MININYDLSLTYLWYFSRVHRHSHVTECDCVCDTSDCQTEETKTLLLPQVNKCLLDLFPFQKFKGEIFFVCFVFLKLFKKFPQKADFRRSQLGMVAYYNPSIHEGRLPHFRDQRCLHIVRSACIYSALPCFKNLKATNKIVSNIYIYFVIVGTFYLLSS